jgi:hypothetical protein
MALRWAQAPEYTYWFRYSKLYGGIKNRHRQQGDLISLLSKK